MTKTITFPSSKNSSNNGIQFDVYNSDPETTKTEITSKNSKDCRILHVLRKHIAIILVFAFGIITGAIIVATIILVNPITVNINSQRPNTFEEDNLNTGDTWVQIDRAIDSPNDFRLLDFLRKHIALLSVCALGIVTILLIVTIIILLQRSLVPITVNIVSQAIEANSSNFKLISRQHWLAQPPVEPPNPLQTPVPYVIIHHTQTENCSSQAQCVFYLRYIQAFHIESRNWWDIGYNFLVGGDGEAYEGRGWKAEGAHTYGYNSKSIGIAFIGTFNSYKPPQIQITACKQLIAKGVELGYISKDYKLLAIKQLQTTKSPGDALYEEMKTWDHWATGP